MAGKNKNKLKNQEVPEEEIVAEQEKKAETETLKSTVLKTSEKWKAVPITGLFFILVSVALLIAFVSFFFTWKDDYSSINPISLNTVWTGKTENWLANIGAVLSYLFIYHWFGLAAMGFIPLFFLAGYRLLAGYSWLPLKKTLRITLFLMVWLSVAMGYFFHSSDNTVLGGGIGFYSSDKLEELIGKPGTLLLLLFLILSFLLLNEIIKFPLLLRKAPAIKESPVHEVEEEIKTVEENATNPLPKNTVMEEIIAPATVEFKVEKTPTPVKNEEKKEIEFSIEKVNTAKKKEKSDELPEVKEKNTSLYDPTLDLSSYQFPPLNLLKEHGSNEVEVSKDELVANKDRIVKTLGNYGIGIQKIQATTGPTVTLYEIVPEEGTRISKIKNLEDDIALSLAALGIRIIAPMPGKGTIGIEVPNNNPGLVSMYSIIDSPQFRNAKMELPIGLGKTISNEPYVIDLTKMPHLLMAGATGQGKSVGLNAVLISLLYKKHPSQIKFVLVDPKKVELTLFNKIENHFLAKLPDTEDAIITDTKQVIKSLNSLCIEMDDRYGLLQDAEVRNISEYNTKFVSRRLNPEQGHKYLPYIVLVIDEFADLIMTAGKEIETPLARLAQLARATGIHLVIATQRPSVNIITGTIKANFPARIAFRVISKIDSRTILDSGGADQLIGKGDMLLLTGSDIIRLQCAFVDTPEVAKVAEFIGSQQGYPQPYALPEYVDEAAEGQVSELGPDEKDPLFEQSARVVVDAQQGSASLLQRRLKIGYNRAGRIIDQLQAAGIIGPFEGSKAREVLLKDHNSLAEKLRELSSGDDFQE